MLRITPFIHVSSVGIRVAFMTYKKVATDFFPRFSPSTQDVAYIHLLVYLCNSMQSVVLRQNVAQVDLVPN